MDLTGGWIGYAIFSLGIIAPIFSADNPLSNW